MCVCVWTRCYGCIYGTVERHTTKHSQRLSNCIDNRSNNSKFHLCAHKMYIVCTMIRFYDNKKQQHASIPINSVDNHRRRSICQLTAFAHLAVAFAMQSRPCITDFQTITRPQSLRLKMRI